MYNIYIYIYVYIYIYIYITTMYYVLFGCQAANFWPFLPLLTGKPHLMMGP